MGQTPPRGRSAVSQYRGMRYTAGIGTYAGIPVRVHATFPLVFVV